MVHEYDAAPRTSSPGSPLAETSQLHPRYAPYYQGGMPWELVFIDLDNGAQLMLAVLAFHDTEDGTVAPIVGAGQPTYAVDDAAPARRARRSPLADALHVEHLSYRKTIVGRVPTFAVYVNGRLDAVVGLPGQLPRRDASRRPDGKRVRVPPFDLGADAADRPGRAASTTRARA